MSETEIVRRAERGGVRDRDSEKGRDTERERESKREERESKRASQKPLLCNFALKRPNKYG